MGNKLVAIRRIDFDTRKIEKRTNFALLRMWKRMKLPVSAFFDLDDVREEITELLTDASVLAHLIGMKRSYLLRPKKAPAFKLSIFDESLEALGQQLEGVDVQGLQEQYHTNVLKDVDKLTENAEREMRVILIESHEEGKHPNEIKKTLQKVLDSLGSKANAETLARTQTQLAYNAGRWQANQDPDIQEILWGYEYSAILDGRVRPEHEAMDGTALPKDNPFWVNNWPPNGWNCRCSVIPLFDPEPEKQPTRMPDGFLPEPDKGFAYNPGSLTVTQNINKLPRRASDRKFSDKQWAEMTARDIRQMTKEQLAQYEESLTKQNIPIIPVKLIEEFPPANPLAHESLDRFTDKKGNLTPEREELHKKIVKEALKDVESNKTPAFYLTHAAIILGRKKILNTIKGALKLKVLTIESAVIEEDMPEYKALKSRRKETVDAILYEENERIVNRILAEGIAKSANISIDESGGSSFVKLKQNVENARKKGYKVISNYSIDEVESADAAARNIRRTLAETLPNALKSNLFDEATVWKDNEKVVEHKDGKTVIHDAIAWNRFISHD